jgi:Flp pilus assembly protein TadD
LTLKPKDFEALMSLAMSLGVAGRYDEAIAYGKEALELRPNSERIVMVVAMTYVQKGDKETARTYLPVLRELDTELAKVLERALAR